MISPACQLYQPINAWASLILEFQANLHLHLSLHNYLYLPLYLHPYIFLLIFSSSYLHHPPPPPKLLYRCPQSGVSKAETGKRAWWRHLHRGLSTVKALQISINFHKFAEIHRYGSKLLTAQTVWMVQNKKTQVFFWWVQNSQDIVLIHTQFWWVKVPNCWW